MIEIPTVLVLGAGASAPFGFPSGQTLADLIVYYFSLAHKGYVVPGTTKWLNVTMTQRMWPMLTGTFPEEDIKDFMEHLNGEDSIDAFLEHQDEAFVNIGKATIAAALLPFEGDKDLDWRFMERRLTSFVGRENHGPKNNWYQLLWRALNARFGDFDKNAIKIITFNYDRSLEHYLYTRLRRRYPKRKDEDYAAKMPQIEHIHGSLGPLSWQVQRAAPEVSPVPYGAMARTRSPVETEGQFDVRVRIWFDTAMQQIKVIHEVSDDTPELETARTWISNCERLYFLGFGYHQSNLDRLAIESAGKEKKAIMGTTMGLSLDRRQHMFELIKRLRPLNYQRNLAATPHGTVGDMLPDCDVYTFLHDHVNLTPT